MKAPHYYDFRKASHRALRHVHVSGGLDCDPAAFEEALRTGRAEGAAHGAIQLFLAEGEPHSITAVVAEHASTFAVLAGLARDLLPPGHPTIAFLVQPPS